MIKSILNIRYSAFDLEEIRNPVMRIIKMEAYMDIPDLNNPMWTAAVTKDIQYGFEFLALQILLSRLRLIVKQKPGGDTVKQSAAELRELFVKSIQLPKAQKDLMKLMQQEGVK